MDRCTCLAAVIGCLCTGPLRAQCETDQLNSPKGTGGDLFGPVAMSGSTLVVGDAAAFDFAGAVFVYQFEGGSWTLEDVIRSPDADPEDAFGVYIDIDGDTLAIGVGQAGVPQYSGLVYVYRRDRDSGDWDQEAILTASDGDFGDNLGNAVAVDGQRILAGAPADEWGEYNNVGSAYIFERIEGRWTEVTKLEDPDPGEFHRFGDYVALSGAAALVGAPGHNAAGDFSGSAFVFREGAGGEWNLEAELIPEALAHHDDFGTGVALCGEVAVSGAPNANTSGTDSGTAWVFRYREGLWVEETQLIPSGAGPFEFLGTASALDEQTSRILLGAPFTNFDEGKAYLFEFDGGGWIETIELTPDPEAPTDGHFGTSVAMVGDLAAIGAPGQCPAPGMVYSYAGMSGADCDDNGELDGCEIAEGTGKDANDNGLLDVCECPTDIDADGDTDVDDLVAVLLAWGAADSPADVDSDGTVGVDDMTSVLLGWGKCVR